MSALDAAGADALARAVHADLLAAPPAPPAGLDGRIASRVRDRAPLLDPVSAAQVQARVRARITGLGPLEPLLADPGVTEVLVHRGREVWVERAGVLERTPIELHDDDAGLLLERVVTPLGRRIDVASPIVDARLPDGSRLHAVIPPLAVDGTAISIRRFSTATLPVAAFCGPAVAEVLAGVVAARANVLVCGGTGSGKTTLLNTLAGLLDPDERVVTIEDAAELRLPGRHVVRLEARPATPDGPPPVTLRDLVRAALRMRPDRIVVGEVRGPEALDLLLALNTGHAGSLSTCHANSCADALRRLATLVLLGEIDLPLAAVETLVSRAVDAVVHVRRGVDGARCVTRVCEVGDDGGVRDLAVGDRVVGRPERWSV